MAYIDIALERLEGLAISLSNVKDRPDYNLPGTSHNLDEYWRLYRYVIDHAPERIRERHKLNPITKIVTSGMEDNQHRNTMALIDSLKRRDDYGVDVIFVKEGVMVDKEKLMWLICLYANARQSLGYHSGMEEDDPIYIKAAKTAEDARVKLVDFIGVKIGE